MLQITKNNNELGFKETSDLNSLQITESDDNYKIDFIDEENRNIKEIFLHEYTDKEYIEIINDFFANTFDKVINSSGDNIYNLYTVVNGSQPQLSYTSDNSSIKIIKLKHIGYRIIIEGKSITIDENSEYKEIGYDFIELFNDMKKLKEEKVKKITLF